MINAHDSYKHQAPHVVLGLGHTGWSVARFLASQKKAVICMDSRDAPPLLPQIKKDLPTVCFLPGGFDREILDRAVQIVVSPGISLNEPVIESALRQGAKIVGDIELFAQQAKAPIIAITGSNAKSTVTTLVAEMLKAAGHRMAVGGNLGTPALDLLQQPGAEFFVLELSSFQLETTYALNAAASVLLNVSEDHLDRHGTFKDYIDIKRRVYQGDGMHVFNADDPIVRAMSQNSQDDLFFTLQVPEDERYFGLRQQGQETWLSCGEEKLLEVRSLAVSGLHNYANILAALALGRAVGLDFQPMITAAQSFRGLPHRCELVKTLAGVRWVNDSKGTNVGATKAAVIGLGIDQSEASIVLIAGGISKDADFTPLREVAGRYLKSAVLIGRDANQLEAALADIIPVIHQQDMDSAVAAAAEIAAPGDTVLLSPACASFDMFADYQERGRAFIQAVEDLV
ncbi:MAG TPA: UDP-N-acetylmuramoyl-L-alanine--D-glutamate ligase [Gammaproteobacteria bacterium]|nr:UDP-N-acetylmuramoyl-L-alanine--D-glutamate ligase [Gammaproteobacteria bacterium]